MRSSRFKMGYNISDVGGQATDGVDVWNATLDLSLSNATTVSGDFDVVSIFSGASQGEATDGYSFSTLSEPTLGTLVFNETAGTYVFTVDWNAGCSGPIAQDRRVAPQGRNAVRAVSP